MLGILGQPQLIPLWLRINGITKRRTLRSDVFGNRNRKRCLDEEELEQGAQGEEQAQ
jgi:hypothetical protein